VTIQLVLGSFCVRNTTLNGMTTATFQGVKVKKNKTKKKVKTIKDTIDVHDDCLFSERTGKLQTGFTCHYKFNSDTLHFISTGAQLIEDLEAT